MRSTIIAFALAFILSTGAGWADTNPSKPVFDQLKSLQGTWAGTTPDGPMTVEYKVIANGSAVMETLFKGTPGEMVSMYYLDGDDLVMTHYCAAGNQPHMKLAPSSTTKEWTFQFDGGTNIDVENGTYMQGAVYTLDGNAMSWRGSGVDKGKPMDCGTVKLNKVQ